MRLTWLFGGDKRTEVYMLTQQKHTETTHFNSVCHHSSLIRVAWDPGTFEGL